MYIKELIIESNAGVIRHLNFKMGLNIVVDNTPNDKTTQTGNNVGKTTVLKLIDFCLGASPSIIYHDTESKKDKYILVENFLSDKEVCITLVLCQNLEDENSNIVIIKRNFLKRTKNIRMINGNSILEKDFETELEKAIFPSVTVEKPSFRQIISHNIRYKDQAISNTIKTLNQYTNKVEYETLHLFLMGCSINDGAKKQALSTKLKQEMTYRERLEKNQTRSAYEVSLSLLNTDIDELNTRKSAFKVNEDFERDLGILDNIKYQINKAASLVSKMRIRKSLIEDSINELQNSITKIDIIQLGNLYREAKLNVDGIQKTFEDLVSYHNKMIEEKVRFITADLPVLNERILSEDRHISELLIKEKSVANKITKGDSFEELELLISEINEKYRMKGEYENILAQLDEADGKINDLKMELSAIDSNIFSEEFSNNLKNKRDKFNRCFSSVSQFLYSEQYALKYEVVYDKKKDQTVYEFSTFNANMSTGKKQGEVLCFDLAYILYANEENIEHLNFLLNDKKELLHDNQLIQVSN